MAPPMPSTAEVSGLGRRIATPARGILIPTGLDRAQTPSMPPSSMSLPPPASPSMFPNEQNNVLRAELEHLRSDNEALGLQLAAQAEVIATLRANVIAEAEADVVILATAIARRVVGAELETRPELIVAWVNEGIRHLGDGNVEVRVGPLLASRISPATWERAHAGIRVTIVEGAEDYHCEIRTTAGRIAETVRTRIEAIVEAFEAK